jgi:hypothetical protein
MYKDICLLLKFFSHGSIFIALIFQAMLKSFSANDTGNWMIQGADFGDAYLYLSKIIGFFS